MSGKDFKEITKDITEQLGSLRAVAPMKGFSDLAAEATKAGALDEKTKEFIALAIGITQHCDGCIGFHAKKLAKLGATKEEIAETLSMCVYMGGGPALMYAADAWKAFEQFSES
ncbi:MAG: carboxymuconolactone decarboxylase family protein [Alphaproteobacteria bacterium]|nr:carboxymuconolactone decarboxylase family protein [Alphaproteobacteria bacterium]